MFQPWRLTFLCLYVKLWIAGSVSALTASGDPGWVPVSHNSLSRTSYLWDTSPRRAKSHLLERSRRQIGSDSFRSMFFKPPCFGRVGFFEDPFSCSHYHHCMLNGTHVRRTCMAPLQFSEERQMCGEPGTVDCPDLPDFWLAAGAAAAAVGATAPGTTTHVNTNTNPNAIVPAGSNANNMAPFSSAPASHHTNPSNNPFLSHSTVTFNSPPQASPHPAGGGGGPSHGSPAAWGNPFSSRHHHHAPPLPPPSDSAHGSPNGILMGGSHNTPPQQQHQPGSGGGGGSGGSSSFSRSTPADRDPFHSNDPPSVITTHSNRRPVAGNGGGGPAAESHLGGGGGGGGPSTSHHPHRSSSPLRAIPTENGHSHGSSTGGHLQIHPNLPQPAWLDTAASSSSSAQDRFPSQNHVNPGPPPSVPRYFPRHGSSLYQVRNPSPQEQAPPSAIHDTVPPPPTVDHLSGSSSSLLSDPSHHLSSFYTAALGATVGGGPHQHMTGLLTLKGPETPPDAVLDQMALNDAGVSSAVVQKVISNFMKAETVHAPAVLSAALQIQTTNTCSPDQRGFFADTANDCRGYFFCSPFGDRAEFNCPSGRHFSEKTVSCESMEQSTCNGLTTANQHALSSGVPDSGSGASVPDKSQQQKPVMLRSNIPSYEYPPTQAAGLDVDLLAHLRRPPAISWGSPSADPLFMHNPYLVAPPPQPYQPIHSMAFGPYHPPNAIQSTEAEAMPIKPPSSVLVGHEEANTANRTTSVLESSLRNAWNSGKAAPANPSPGPEPVAATEAPAITPADLAPTTNKAEKDASSSEEMLAVETKLIPMANSISKAFDNARQMEAAAIAAGSSSLGSGKNFKPFKFAGSRRIIDAKLLADLGKS
ncbi:hypothetical protein BV898_04308 [Hypsibius exemplaris]|uniref:Chitin-binding type-2 domain-containing protein n=1 Tax=Hypsibius exemplaris TaxID=2072580 RepID=A0A1W0X2W0_HYPEX|nr:hypothetical protein BV898_04308 [Hypsibius exemplaris]